MLYLDIIVFGLIWINLIEVISYIIVCYESTILLTICSNKYKKILKLLYCYYYVQFLSRKYLNNFLHESYLGITADAQDGICGGRVTTLVQMNAGGRFVSWHQTIALARSSLLIFCVLAKSPLQ